VVGFIGPEYLYDGKQIIRAGSRTISAASSWACRWAATSATPITPRPTRTTWTRCSTLLTAAGVNFVMGVPGADDIMLGYQSTSFHDALAMRDLLGRRPAPEFEAWLARQGLIDTAARIRPRSMPGGFRALLPA
jgi:Ethanolamine ammonia-lyase, large subunit